MYVDKSAIGLLRRQQDEGVWGATFEALKHEAGSSSRRRQGVGVFVAFDESEVIRPGKFEWRNICNQVRKSRCIMAFGTRQQNDVGHSQTCGAIEESSFSHIPTLTIPGIEFGATGIAKLYCQTFGESDEFQPVRQREVKTAREYDGIDT
jgi:hypothetical protein